MRDTLVFHVTVNFDVDEALSADEIASLRQKLKWLSAALYDHTSRQVEQLTVDLGDRYTVANEEVKGGVITHFPGPVYLDPTNAEHPLSTNEDTEEDWARYREEEGLPPL